MSKPTPKNLLISVRPIYANKLISGEKKIELRRTRPNITAGDRVLLYASSPEKSLKAVFEVIGLLEETPKRLWEKTRTKAGIARKDFFEYYAGAKLGYGISLCKVWVAPEPVSLSRLRDVLPGFQPPQVYRYLSSSEVQTVFPQFDQKAV